MELTKIIAKIEALPNDQQIYRVLFKDGEYEDWDTGFTTDNLIALAAFAKAAEPALRTAVQECRDIRTAVRKNSKPELIVLDNSFYVIQDAAEAALAAFDGGNDER